LRRQPRYAFAVQFPGIIVRHEDFGVRWQSAPVLCSPATRDGGWTAATPLRDADQSYKGGVAPALRDSRRTPKSLVAASAAPCLYVKIRSENAGPPQFWQADRLHMVVAWEAIFVGY